MQTLSQPSLLSRHRFYHSLSDIVVPASQPGYQTIVPKFGSLTFGQGASPAPFGQEDLRLVGDSYTFKGVQFTSEINGMLNRAIRSCIGSSSAEQMQAG